MRLNNKMAVNAPVPTFPQFEKIFEEGRTEPFLRQVERTRLQLNHLQTKGESAPERNRAAAAFEAYSKALALLKEVDDERRRLAESSGGASPAASTK